ncbi:hypothetical protein HHX47_DHR9000566 [Lentinula edodes]|nr:hypothetical protein HHX47_DHR9000566 [Lentinula edodes]
MTRISPIPEKGSSPDTARTSADDNSPTTPDLQTQTQWSIGERPTPSASHTSMNEIQTPGPANIKAKGTPKKGAGSKKPDALTNASFPLPIEPPTSTINISGDVLAILKLSTSEKKNRIIDVGKVVDANFRVLGGLHLELEKRLTDHSAHIGEDIAELATRLDNLEVADLTSIEGGPQDTSLPSQPVSAGVGILHDLKSRISALEEETDEEGGNDIRVAETEKMVKKLRGDISNMKDKADLDRQFAKTLATPKDVNDARTFATREVAMLRTKLSDEIKSVRALIPKDSVSKRVAPLESRIDILNSKVEDLEGKLNRALAENELLRAQIHSKELNRGRSLASAPDGYQLSQSPSPHRHHSQAPGRYRSRSASPFSQRRHALPPPPPPPPPTSTSRNKRRHSASQDSRPNKKGQQQNPAAEKVSLYLGPFPPTFCVHSMGHVRRWFSEVVQPTYCPYILDATDGYYKIAFGTRADADGFMASWKANFAQSDLQFEDITAAHLNGLIEHIQDSMERTLQNALMTCPRTADTLKDRKEYDRKNKKMVFKALAFRHYLTVPTGKHRKALIHMVTGNHQLAVERLRWNERNRPRIIREHRICRICKCSVEDPAHVLFECKGSTELIKLRDSFMQKVISELPQYAKSYSNAWMLFRILLAETRITELFAKLTYDVLEVVYNTEMFVPA